MTKTGQLLLAAIVAGASLLGATTPARAADPLPLLPWPAQVTPAAGDLLLVPAGAFVAAEGKEAQSLRQLLVSKLAAVTGVQLTVDDGLRDEAIPATVVFKIDPSIGKNTYKLEIGDQINVTATDYRAGTWAVSTLVQLAQAAESKEGQISFPRLNITDSPHFQYPGLMVDVGRNRISLDTLREVVILCSYYKIPYLQLHLSDDQGFSFPSKSFTSAGSKNGAMRGPKVEVYSIDGLKDLVKFAGENGVAIIPEIEMPGHSGALQRSVPEIFGYKNLEKPGQWQSLSVINLTNEAIYPAIDKLIGDLCDVFTTTPFIHIGCDEVYFGELEKRPELAAYLKEHNLKNVRQLYPRFINRVNAIVKKHGKQTIVWEAFRADEKVDKDITVLAWDGWNYPADELIRDGYRTIHVPWTPSIYSTSKELYNDWDPYNPHGHKLSKDAPLFGAMMVYWEQTDDRTMPLLRMKTPIRQERIWNTDANKSLEDMAARLTAADKKLDRLLYGFDVDIAGLTHPRNTWVLAGVNEDGLNTGFATEATISLTRIVPAEGQVIHYTTDGKEVTADSPMYDKPLKLTDSTVVRARLFNSSGQPAGLPWYTKVEYQPFQVVVTNTVSPTDLRFDKPATITVDNVPSTGTIRYMLKWNKGNEVSPKAPAYTGPITVDAEQGVALQYFDANNKPHGYRWEGKFEKVDFDPTNITYKKPVTASSHGYDSGPEYLTDGIVQVKDFSNQFWGSSSATGPQWATIDLEKTAKLSGIRIYPYFDGHRYYQYTVAISTDNKNWTTVADMSKNETPAVPEGTLHEFAPADARYIKVTMIKNSANQGLHVVEVRAYEAK